MHFVLLMTVGFGAAREWGRSFKGGAAILIVAVTGMLTGCTLVFSLVGGTVAGIHNLAVDDDVPATPASPTERDRAYQACINRQHASDAATVKAPPQCHPAGEDDSPPESKQWSVGRTMGGSLLVGLAVDVAVILYLATNPIEFN